MPEISAKARLPSANALMIGIPEISATLKMVPEVKLLSIKNNWPEVPSKESELSLSTLRLIGEFPELKKLNVNDDEPVFPNVPELNNKAPETPRPEPNLTLPETPRPPVTVSAPVVDDVEFVLLEMLSAPLIIIVELNTAVPLAVNPPVTPSPPDVIFTLEFNVETPPTLKVELNVTPPVTPRPPAAILTFDPKLAAPATATVELNVAAPVTPKPPDVIFTLEFKVDTPLTFRVEENVTEPVTPNPPDVMFTLELLV